MNAQNAFDNVFSGLKKPQTETKPVADFSKMFSGNIVSTHEPKVEPKPKPEEEVKVDFKKETKTFEEIPVGSYPCFVESGKIKMTRSGDKPIIVITYTILDGPLVNRKIFQTFNIVKNDKTANEFQIKDFKSFYMELNQCSEQEADMEYNHLMTTFEKNGFKDLKIESKNWGSCGNVAITEKKSTNTAVQTIFRNHKFTIVKELLEQTKPVETFTMNV